MARELLMRDPRFSRQQSSRELHSGGCCQAGDGVRQPSSRRGRRRRRPQRCQLWPPSHQIQHLIQDRPLVILHKDPRHLPRQVEAVWEIQGMITICPGGRPWWRHQPRVVERHFPQRWRHPARLQEVPCFLHTGVTLLRRQLLPARLHARPQRRLSPRFRDPRLLHPIPTRLRLPGGRPIVPCLLVSLLLEPR